MSTLRSRVRPPELAAIVAPLAAAAAAAETTAPPSNTSSAVRLPDLVPPDYEPLPNYMATPHVPSSDPSPDSSDNLPSRYPPRYTEVHPPPPPPLRSDIYTIPIAANQIRECPQSLDINRKTCCFPSSCLSCLLCSTRIRILLQLLLALGVICTCLGAAMGVAHIVSKDGLLSLALMFIGLGLLLIIVVTVGWHLLPPHHEPCHAVLGIADACTTNTISSPSGTTTDATSSSSPTNQRQVPCRGHRSRQHLWYGGVLYPEFNYRRPPPSYNVSMREHQSISSPPHLSLNGLPAAVAPPPAYRSNSSTRDSSPTQIYSDSLPPIYRTAPRTTSITIDTHL